MSTTAHPRSVDGGSITGNPETNLEEIAVPEKRGIFSWPFTV